MNRYRIILAALCCLCLLGCGRGEDPYRVDTVVRIPVDPTEETAAATEVTEAPTEPETEPPTETAALEETVEPTEAASGFSGKKSTSTKKPTSTKKSNKSEKPKETEPPTEAPTEPKETAAPTQPQFNPSDYSPGKLEKAIAEEMNACRSENETADLKLSTKLCGIAALRAREAARVWSHNRPDGSRFTTAMSDYGYGFSTAAELLAHATGSGKASSIVGKWMDSDSAEDILSDEYSKVGVGIYKEDGITWVAVLLAG